MWVQPREHKKVGKILSAAREDAGLTQHVLAKRLSKPQSFVSSYECGQRRVDLLEFLRISGAIGTDPIRLFADIVKAEMSPKAKVPKR